eukprot:contig_3370_g711
MRPATVLPSGVLVGTADDGSPPAAALPPAYFPVVDVSTRRHIRDRLGTGHAFVVRSGGLAVLQAGFLASDSLVVEAEPSGGGNRDGGKTDTVHLAPMGYRAARLYWSYVAPGGRTAYLLEVIGGDGAPPAFRATAADDPTGGVEAPTAADAWLQI